MKKTIAELVRVAVATLPAVEDPAATAALAAAPEIERTRDTAHGDFACNIAMRLARVLRRKPRELAEVLVRALPPDPAVARVEIAGPGFINFFLTPAAYHGELARVFSAGDSYGTTRQSPAPKVLLEFVSANPTGPLHVGHGRHAAYGGALSSLLTAAGYEVSREYYINDAGRQVDILAVSVWLRYLEALGEPVTFPANAYRGDYLKPIATQLVDQQGRALHRPAADIYAGLPPDEPQGGNKETYIDAVIARMRQLLGDSGFAQVLERSLDGMLADIRDDLAALGVTFDRWYSERSLDTSGAIDAALARLEQNGHLYRKDGATWFRASQFGDDEDRVVVRENGARTYFASDIAYHLDKRLRGFDHLIDVLGADHHGYVARVRGGLAAMGEPPECFEVCLMQLVSLYRGGEKVPMGKREGQFVTLRQLREEVGNDACRFYYVMRSHEQPLDFDLELAKSRSNDNPVYYIQYAHARVASVLRQLADRGLRWNAEQGRASLALLVEAPELALMTTITRYPELVESAAAQRAPHLLVHYLRELANDFHSYYNALPFIVDSAPLRDARLSLILATQQVIRNGLRLLGVGAPESM